MKKLYIIDGNSLMNRAFYALPLLANSNGDYSNAVFGFINCVIKLISENKPDFLVVAFDHARKTFRNEIFANYKAGRKEMPVELRSQFPIVKDILKAMNITCIEQEGIEADDIIGTIVKNSKTQNIIITGDRDSLQLIDENTIVWLTQRGITDIKEVNLLNIQELYELSPSQVIDYKALAGDSSDNIPGVSGIGDKTAISLLKDFGNICNIYQNIENIPSRVKNKLKLGKEMCDLSYKLATINTNCGVEVNVDDYLYDFPFGQTVKDYFKKYNFNAFLKKDIFSFNSANGPTMVNDINSLKEIINDFSGDYFSFDFRNKFYFGFNNKSYVIEKEITLFDNDPINIQDFVNLIMPILKNNKIIKIVSDIKAHLHQLKLDCLENVFDIKLAYYLTTGGNKLEQNLEIGELYDSYINQKQELEKLGMTELYYNIELPLVFVLYNMETQGFKIETTVLNDLDIEYSKELAYIEREILKHSLNSDLNIKSAKQLSVFLFEELGLSDKGNKKHSTSVEVLNEFVDEHPVVPLILRYRKVLKLHSTYIEPYKKLTTNSPIIHTYFNQMLTSTGRLSSSEPNLQNIPVRDDEGRNLRKLFVSRFDGGKIVSADYNQIELRLLANFSQDENLIADYNKGADIHRYTASQIFGKAPECISDKDRRTAKAVNFGIIYGISSFGLSKNIDVSVKEAQEYINVYFKKYPGVKNYLDGLIESAKQNGYVKTLYNRLRFIPELASNNSMQKAFGERIAMNMPLQGSASDIIKIAMVRVFNKLKQLGLKSKLILQIHDELIVDTAPNEEDIVKNILKTEMEGVYNNSVPLLVEVGSGTTWFDSK